MRRLIALLAGVMIFVGGTSAVTVLDNNDGNNTATKTWTFSNLNNTDPSVSGSAATATGSLTGAGSFGASENFSLTASSVIGWDAASAQSAISTGTLENYLSGLTPGNVAGRSSGELGADSRSVYSGDDPDTLGLGSLEALVYTVDTSSLGVDSHVWLKSVLFQLYGASDYTDVIIYDVSDDVAIAAEWNQNYNGDDSVSGNWVLEDGDLIVIAPGTSNGTDQFRVDLVTLDVTVGDPTLAGWRVIPEDPTYPTDDSIVAFCEVTDALFNLPADTANTDCTAAFQSALNLASAAGGGTVFVPAGEYRIEGTLSIPGNVHLRGRWREITASAPAAGTILALYNTGTTAVISTAGNGSGVRDLTFWHPGQSVTANSAVEYPFVLSVNNKQATIENVTFINAYNGIDSSLSSMCFMRGIYGSPLNLGLTADKSYAVSRFDGFHFSPDYWAWSGLPGSPAVGGAHASYIKSNATGLNIREMDGFYFYFSTISGYQNGVRFQAGVTGSTPHGDISAVSAVDCVNAMRVEGASHLNITHSTFIGDDYGINSTYDCGLTINKCTMEGGINSIYATAGDVNLMNCTVTGSKNVAGALHENTSATVVPEFNMAYDKVRKPAKTDLFNVADYGAVGNGVADDTAAVQAAVADAVANGGGIVFVPAGEYLMTGTLNLGAGVELRGNSGGRHLADASKELGSLFLVNVGKGSETGTAFVTLGDNSGIRGVSFHYPDQDYTNFAAYPFTIRGNGVKNYIIDCSLSNPYQSIELNGDDHLVEYTLTGGLKRNFRANNCTGGRIQNLHVKSDFWRDISMPNSPSTAELEAFKWKVNEICETFYLNGCDNYSISSIFNHATHIMLTADNSSGQALLLGCEYSQAGFLFKNGTKTFDLINSLCNISSIGDDTGKFGIKSLPGFGGQARCFVTAFKGTQDETWNVADGNILLQLCTLSGSSDRGAMNFFCGATGTIEVEAGSISEFFGVENQGTFTFKDVDFVNGCLNSVTPNYLVGNTISVTYILSDMNQHTVKDYGLVLDQSNIVLDYARIRPDLNGYEVESRQCHVARLTSGADYTFDVTDSHFTDGYNQSVKIKAHVLIDDDSTLEFYYDSTTGEKLAGTYSYDGLSIPAWKWITFNVNDAQFDGTQDVRVHVVSGASPGVGAVVVQSTQLPEPGSGNLPPAFTVDPINEINGDEGAAYSGSIAGDASDPESDSMTFSKVGGPAWLSVAANGALSGTPGAGDVGPNSFTVQVDATGGSDTATLNIIVIAAPDTTAPAAPAALSALAGIGQVTLDWSDNTEGDLAGYTVYRSATSGSGYTALATEVSTSDYVDSTIVNATTYYYVVTALDAAGNESAQSSEASALPGWVAGSAVSDSAVEGTVSGSLADAELNDDVYQTITEVVSGSTSVLEHKWEFNVTGAELVTFYVEAHHSANSEGDDFVFAYSTDDANYTDMMTVTKTADDNTAQYFALPSGLSGTVYVRVLDADRTGGNTQLDSVSVDAIFIVSEESTVAPGMASAATPADGAIDVPVNAQLSWAAGPMSTSHDVYFGTGTPPVFQGNQTATAYDPGALQEGATYYWAVDEVNNSGTTAGSVWSFTTTAAAGDLEPPMPNPSTWAVVPTAISSTEITMTATTATDPSGGVEYRFNNITTGGTSGWQSSPTYTESGLVPGTSYSYEVRSRDALGNKGDYSAALTATTTSAGWTELSFDDFESGWGNWVDGGSDAMLSSSFAIGGQCVNLQDNSSSSEIELSSSLDLSGYSELKIEFSYVVQSFERSEDFRVRFSEDGGSSWNTIQSYVNDVDFVDDGTRYNPELILDSASYNFTSNVQIKFECDASKDDDDIYIDDVRISVQ